MKITKIMKPYKLIMVLLLGLIVSACTEQDDKLVTRLIPQNANPHLNALSIQRGEGADNYFDVAIQVGKRKKEVRKKSQRYYTPPPQLVKVQRISFTLEYWDPVVQFVYDFERGDFFEQKVGDDDIQYHIGSPFVDEETGLTLLSIDVFIDSVPDYPDKLASEQGELLVLKFRANRSGVVPLNFATLSGQVYNHDGERITGISWYGGLVESHLEPR